MAHTPDIAPLSLRALVAGLGVATALWTAWFLTHLPLLNVPEPASLVLLLVVWTAASTALGRCFRSTEALPGGLLAGAITFAFGLLILGSKLTPPPASGTGPAGDTYPQAWMIVLGFLAASLVIGCLGALAGSRLRPPDQPVGDIPAWRARLAFMTAGTFLPLVVIGGLVTSTNSGMAVPDWPNTFGSNMFLYPLGPRAAPDVFFEHSHRLFGTLAGGATILLLASCLAWPSPRAHKAWAFTLLALVVAQGLLGAWRVLQGSPDVAKDSHWLSAIHGVLGQVTFALAVGVAVAITPGSASPIDHAWTPGRRLRAFASGTLHAALVQLVFGAMYRHLRSAHALWSHAGFSIVVTLLAIMAGAVALKAPREWGAQGRAIRRLGQAMLAIVVVQFLLGWAAFAMGGKGREPGDLQQALIRTIHQANGAFFLGVAASLMLLARRAWALSSSKPSTADSP